MAIRAKLGSIRTRWQKLRSSRGFRNVLLYLVFVAIAGSFWLIMSLNDNSQKTFAVQLRLYNVPDSITFIEDLPTRLHVTVCDRGTSLLRNGILRRPTLEINFREYADRGVFRYSAADLYSTLRHTFGASAQVTSVSIDSLHCTYTSLPGRRVPLRVLCDVTAAPGHVIASRPTCSVRQVTIYSNMEWADTITAVTTDRLVKRGMKDSGKFAVRVHPVPGVKIVPAKVDVTVHVEPLVKKKSTVPVNVSNVPAGESLLIFPANVEVTYFVPMDRFNDKDVDITVEADYNDLATRRGRRLPIRVTRSGRNFVNATLLTDSVEYTIVRQ